MSWIACFLAVTSLALKLFHSSGRSSQTALRQRVRKARVEPQIHGRSWRATALCLKVSIASKARGSPYSNSMFGPLRQLSLLQRHTCIRGRRSTTPRPPNSIDRTNRHPARNNGRVLPYTFLATGSRSPAVSGRRRRVQHHGRYLPPNRQRRAGSGAAPPTSSARSSCRPTLRRRDFRAAAGSVRSLPMTLRRPSGFPESARTHRSRR